MGQETWIVLFAHGSSDPHWTGTLEALARRLQGCGGPAPIRLAYMEFARPALDQVAAEAAGAGARRLILLPLFLSSGGHVSRDIPPQVEEVRRRHPDLRIEVLPPVGEDERFAGLVGDLVREAAARTP